MAKNKSSNVPIPEGEPIAAVSTPVSPPQPTASARPSITEKDIAASSVKQSVFDLAYEHRRMVYTAIKSGTFPLLPDKDGNIDASRPANLVSGYGYKGPTILILKAHQASNGFPSPEYVAESQLEEANKRAGLHGITIANPHPVTISISDSANPGADGKPSVKFVRLYNLAETAHPDAVRELAKQRSIEREQSFNDWQNSKAAEDETFEIRPYYQPRRRESQIVFKINERDPEKYLAQVFTAMSLGTNNIKVNPDTAEVLRDNFIHYLYDRNISKSTGKEINNPMTVYSLGNRASALCKDNLRTMFTKPEQTRTQARQTDDMAMGM
jgi:hypothetical protein